MLKVQSDRPAGTTAEPSCELSISHLETRESLGAAAAEMQQQVADLQQALSRKRARTQDIPPSVQGRYTTVLDLILEIG